MFEGFLHTGDSKQAERLYREAVAGQEALSGLDHPETLKMLRNLAVFMWNQGKQLKNVYPCVINLLHP